MWAVWAQRISSLFTSVSLTSEIYFTVWEELGGGHCPLAGPPVWQSSSFPCFHGEISPYVKLNFQSGRVQGPASCSMSQVVSRGQSAGTNGIFSVQCTPTGLMSWLLLALCGLSRGKFCLLLVLRV